MAATTAWLSSLLDLRFPADLQRLALCLALTAVAPATPLAGLRVESVEPTGPETTPFGRLRVGFSEPVREGSLVAGSILLVGPDGTPVPLAAVLALEEAVYELTFAFTPGTGLEVYSLSIGPQVLDGAGQPMDEDGDGTPGEAEADAFRVRLIAREATIPPGALDWDGRHLVVVAALTVQGNHALGRMALWRNAVVTASEAGLSLEELVLRETSSFVLPGEGTLDIVGALDLGEGTTLTIQSTHQDSQVNGAWVGRGGTIRAGRAVVASGARIQADGWGYLERVGPGSATSASGSHGGRGRGNGSAPYGDAEQPLELGSGGHYNTRGGGAIHLVVGGTVQLDGEISADGVTWSVMGYGSAGGSIWIEADTLAGNGTIHANGSARSEQGGGGGRVAVYVRDFAGFDVHQRITASGGSASVEHGTALLFDTSRTGRHVTVLQRHELPPAHNVAYDSLTLAEGTVFDVGGAGALAIGSVLTIRSNALLVAHSVNHTEMTESGWEGRGVTIAAGEVVVATGGRLSADGEGYAERAGPGSASNAAGTHGGRGRGNSSSPYGSAEQPVTLGSGGHYTTLGGGAIRLTVAGTLQLDGEVSADAVSWGSQGYGSAGGSIWIETATLRGSGSIRANGSTRGASDGGGGRVAVYFQDATGFADLRRITATAGGADGQDGTALLFDTSAPGKHLRVFQRHAIAADEAASYASFQLHDGAVLDLGGGASVSVSGPMSLATNAVVWVRGRDVTELSEGQWRGRGATLRVNSLHVAEGARITADGQGYAAQAGPGGSRSADGVHGGRVEGNPALPYGSPTQPVDPGSGGSSYTAGGGAIRLVVTNRLHLDGRISADATTWYQFGGYSAGGSVWIDSGQLAGKGTITADGSFKASSGGSGGRVAVYYDDATAWTGLPGSGARSQASSAGHGTAYFVNRNTHTTTLANGLVLEEDSVLSFPNLTLASNVTLRLGGGSVVEIAGTLRILDGATLLLGGKNTLLQVNDTWVGEGCRMVVGDLVIETGGHVSADGQGYAASDSGQPFRYLGSGPGGGGTDGGGGGYGGRGGFVNRGRTYGSERYPTDLGSGGGGAHSTARGGGAIQVVAGTITLDGRITANGLQNDYGWNRGGGPGGSLFISTGVLSGDGAFTADGGDSAFWDGAFTDGGGGGGRIAVYATTMSSFTGQERSTARPGTGLDPQAGPGTVGFFATPEFSIRLADTYCHGTENLGFDVLGLDFRGVSVALEAAGTNATMPLGDGLTVLDAVTWDTTQLADGRYELRATFTRAGDVVGEARRSVVVLNDAAWHDGELVADTTWEAGKLHLIEGRVRVPDGVRLTIAPGAIVKLIEGAVLHLADGGVLEAPGNGAESSALTSILDDVAGGDHNLDGPATTSRPASWRLLVESKGRVMLHPDTRIAGGLTERAGRTLDSSEFWSGGCVYHVAGNMVIPTNTVLTVQAGAVVKLSGGELQVQAGGRLETLGTPAAPVVFTSLADDSVGGDSNGDEVWTSPAAGDWRGLKCLGGELDLTSARLFYAGAGSESMVRLHGGGTVRLRDCQLRYTTQEAVSQRDGAGIVSLVNCVIANSTVALHALSGTNTAVNCTLADNATGVMSAGTAVLSLVNSIIAYGSQYGVRVVGSPTPSIRYCNVWGFSRGAYNGLSDPTGQDGNLATNPFLLLRQHRDFRLNARSPMIDAGDGGWAPERDHLGLARNVQTNRPPTGLPTPDGRFADIGAFEFNRATAPDVDLAVSDVLGPITADVGGQLSVRWRVTNRGSQPVTGPWFDDVSLVFDPTRTPLVVPVGEVLVASGVTLEPGASYTHEASFRVPGCEPRDYQCQVTTDSRAEIYEADRRTNNVAWSAAGTTVRLPTIELDGTPFTGELIAGQPVWLRLLPAVDDHLELKLRFSRPDTVAPLYVAGGYFPSAYAFEQRSERTATNEVALRIENAAPQPYYLRIEPEKLGSPSVSFTLSPSRLSFAVTSMRPTEAGLGAPTTLTFEGQGFPRDVAIAAVTADGVEVPATAVQYVSSARVLATFTFTHDQAGPADLRLESANAPELRLAEALTVVSGGAPEYYVEVDAPEALRAGRSYAITIRWGNRGVTDAPLLLLEIRAPDWVEIYREPGALRVQDRLWLFTTQPGVPRPVMSPGFEGSRTLHLKVTQAGPFELEVNSWPVGDAVLADYPVDWSQLERVMRRPAISDENWGPYWTRLKERLGSTSAELVRRLADQAVAITAAAEEPNGSGVDFLQAMLREISAALAERPRVVLHEGGGETGGGQVHALLVSSADYTEYSAGGRDLNAGLTDVTRWGHYYAQVAQATDIKTITDAAEWESWSGDDGDVLGPGQRTGYNSIFPHEGAQYLLAAIDDLGESAQPGDTIVFHYSGHATAGGLQLAERDYDNGYVLPFDDIYAALADTQAEKIVVTLDACKSGGMIDTLKTWESSRLANLAMGTNRFYVPEPYIPYEKWVFMTAADGIEGAYEDVLLGGGLMSQRMLTQLVNDWDPVSVPEAYQAMVAEGKLAYDEEFGVYSGAVVSNGLRGNSPSLLCTDPDFSLVGLDEYGEGKDELPTSASSVVPDPEENPSSGPAVRHPMESVRPVDPNEKQTTGVGTNGYVTDATPITYTIFFENDPKSGATAPVQELLVTDSLSSSLDWSTLELIALQFGRTAVTIPAGRDEYHDVLQAPKDPYPVFTDVSLDRQTGALTLWMRSMDTATKDLPLDAFAGFLPVNDASGRGQGSLSFRLRPKPGLANGTVINNQATITFDPTYEVNPPIRTATVRNTMDTQAPSSRVADLPATSSARIAVSWSGSDTNGSGIASYDIYAAVDRGPYLLWLKRTVRTSAVFLGELNRTYSFFSVARDRVGNVEAGKSTAEAQTVVGEPATGYDAWLTHQFSAAELGNPALEATLWGELADPDQDRRNNFAEFFAGSNPRQPDASPFLDAVMEEGRLAIYFRRAREAEAIEAIFDVSTDLRTWERLSEPIEVAQDLGTTRLLRISVPMGEAAARFVRLRW